MRYKASATPLSDLILRILKECPDPMSIEEIAGRINRSTLTVRKIVQGLAATNQVLRTPDYHAPRFQAIPCGVKIVRVETPVPNSTQVLVTYVPVPDSLDPSALTN
jgi:hypothetical protein